MYRNAHPIPRALADQQRLQPQVATSSQFVGPQVQSTSASQEVQSQSDEEFSSTGSSSSGILVEDQGTQTRGRTLVRRGALRRRARPVRNNHHLAKTLTKESIEFLNSQYALRVKRQTDRQTDRQTGRQTET